MSHATTTTIHHPEPPGIKRRMRCIAWKPMARNTLRGFLTIQHASGLVLADIGLHERDGRWWVAPPGKPMVGSDGAVMREPDTGKIRYVNIVSFEPDALRHRWSDAVIDAARRDFPEAFEPAPPTTGAPAPAAPPRSRDPDLDDVIPF